MDLRETVREDVEWIKLAQDGHHWRAFVKTVTDTRFS
jgi:hypothetical protein